MDPDTSNILEAVLEADPGAMAVVSDLDMIFRMVNPAYRAFAVDPEKEMVGRPYADVWQEMNAPTGLPGPTKKPSSTFVRVLVLGSIHTW